MPGGDARPARTNPWTVGGRDSSRSDVCLWPVIPGRFKIPQSHSANAPRCPGFLFSLPPSGFWVTFRASFAALAQR